MLGVEQWDGNRSPDEEQERDTQADKFALVAGTDTAPSSNWLGCLCAGDALIGGLAAFLQLEGQDLRGGCLLLEVFLLGLSRDDVVAVVNLGIHLSIKIRKPKLMCVCVCVCVCEYE